MKLQFPKLSAPLEQLARAHALVSHRGNFFVISIIRKSGSCGQNEQFRMSAPERKGALHFYKK